MQPTDRLKAAATFAALLALTVWGVGTALKAVGTVKALTTPRGEVTTDYFSPTR